MSTEKEFGAQLLTPPDIFENRYFRIPDYQRGYAWGRDQVRDLLNDLEHLILDGRNLRHYTGTLVLSRPEDSDSSAKYDVVDGQQRLTTLTIIIRVLADHLDDECKPAFEEKYIKRGERGHEIFILQLNSITRYFFEAVVLAGGNPSDNPPTIKAHKRLLAAHKLVKDWFANQLKQNVSIEKIRHSVENELGFIVYAPDETDETGVMFEVINNRGKSLSELEKVKNYLIYCSVKLDTKQTRAKINEVWSKILDNLNSADKTSPGDEESFLRYCVVVYFQLSKKDSQYGYYHLKKRLNIGTAIKDKRKPEIIDTIESFLEFLRIASIWYARLYGQRLESVKNKKLVEVLDLIRSQERHASIMPLFLALVIKLDPQEERLTKLLNLLEVLNFRVYMARNVTGRNDSGQARLYQCAQLYFHDKLLASIPEESLAPKQEPIKTQIDALEYQLVDFVLNYSPLSRFSDSFKLETDSPDNFYSWGGLRYLLINYEKKCLPNRTVDISRILSTRKEGKTADYLSIEHLWATDHRSKLNNRKKDSHEKRRLGNFVLLEFRLNSQSKNEGIKEKRTRFLDRPTPECVPTELEHVRIACDAAREALKEFAHMTRSKEYYYSIHKKINDNLEAHYVEFANSRWSLSSYYGFNALINAGGD